MCGNINLAMNEESSERSRLLPESSTFQSNGNICGQCDMWIDSVVVGRSSEDDVVSLGLKRLCVAFSVVIIFWLISFIFIMLAVLFKWSITTWDLVLFLPMWIERRNYMRQLGTDRCALFVDFDSLPLMRRLLCWNIGLCLAFMLVLVAQVLFSLWAIYGIIGLWHALIPVCLLIVGYLLYLFSMRVVSLSTCGFVALAVGQLVLLVLKCNAQMPSASWTLCCAPLLLLLLPGALCYLAWTAAQWIRGRYMLRPTQISAMGGYALALFCVASAAIATAVAEYRQHIPLYDSSATTEEDSKTGDIGAESAHVRIGYTQYILCTVAVVLFCGCVIAVLNMEGRVVAETRGFREPLPLSRYKEGWKPTHGARDLYVLLLGSIKVELRGGELSGKTETGPQLQESRIDTCSGSSAAEGVAISSYGAVGQQHGKTPERARKVAAGDGGIELLPRSAVNSPV